MNYSKLFFCITVMLFFVTFSQAAQNVIEPPIDPDNKGNIDSFQPGVPVRVGIEGYNSVFGYFNTTPESPDGTMIVYVKFLTTPQKSHSEKLVGELWVCKSNLTGHKKITDLKNFHTHNGVAAQWIDNKTIAYEDEFIHMVNLDGKQLITEEIKGDIGQFSVNNKILYAAFSQETKSPTIYEFDVFTKEKKEIANIFTFKDVVNHFSSVNFKDISQWGIGHLQYSPDGSKIALRLTVGEKEDQLVTMDKNGGDIHFFGPKPMHFAWYDNSSIYGYDTQIKDGRKTTDDRLCQWDRDAKYISTLAGPGCHQAAAPNRDYFAGESWYKEIPVILRIYKRGVSNPIWQDTVSEDTNITWGLDYHVNPAFSRDGKRLYFTKCTAPGKAQAYVVVIPETQNK